MHTLYRGNYFPLCFCILVLEMKNLLLVLLFISQLVTAQNWVLQGSVPLKADSFVGVDSYNYVYWLEDNVLHKQEGKKAYSFSDNLLGRIQSVDITNPLTVLVFYYQSQTLVVLDNNLNEVERVAFSKMPEFMEVATVGNAGSRRLWIGNSATQRLELLDYRNKSFEAVSSSFSGDILEQVSNYNYCYVRTLNHIYLYNSYGSVLQKLVATEYDRMFPAYNGIVLQNGEDWYYWQKDTLEPKSISINLHGIDAKNLFFERQYSYVFDGTHLHTYIAEK